MTVETGLLHSLLFMNMHVYDLGNLLTEQPAYPSNSCYEVFNLKHLFFMSLHVTYNHHDH